MSTTVDFHMSVDWRWQRVKELAADEAPPSRSRDDRWVQRAYRYQKRKAALTTGTETRLSTAFPNIHLAYKLHDNLFVHFRWIIEAAVLAAVDQEVLAEYIALTPDVIEAYEMLFFDVRSKLKSRGYVAASVLGPIYAAGLSDNDPDGFWKVLAFNGGWEHVCGCWSAGGATDEAMVFYKSVAIQQVVLKAAASGLNVQPNNFNAVELIRVGVERVQYEEEHGQGVRTDKTTTAVQALMNNIKIVVQDARTKLSADEPRLQLPDAAAIYRNRNVKPDDD